MGFLKYALKTVLCAAVICVVLKILYGLFAIYAALAITAAVICGICAAFVLSPSGSAGFFAADVLHIALVTVLTVLSDRTGVFRAVPYDAADFFAKTGGADAASVNMLWSILYILPLYFISFLLTSAALSAIKNKKFRGDAL